MDNTANEHNNNKQQEREYRAQNGHANLSDLQKKWNAIQEEYRNQYPEVTAEDVDFQTDEFDALTTRLAKRTNKSTEAVKQEIKDWDYKS
ncbi:hypothetical protein FNB79_11030 [Formosa sediminum]|uniref:CsbD family protein n=1 Tax=Formosa sediminum TaxID=2594004 RepID=A0A516GSH8_9FLAO|nr:hypothetical protein [Formosa sediminum]QDO94474.1 hypothetical protein FNB79_11030 [Formosa sediminum]